jgi:hypothetical protein
MRSVQWVPAELSIDVVSSTGQDCPRRAAPAIPDCAEASIGVTVREFWKGGAAPAA